MGAYLPAVLILLVVAIVARVPMVWAATLFLLCLYLASRLWTRAGARSLQITRHCADHAFTGDAVPVLLTVHNRGRLPLPWLEVNESAPLELRSGGVPPQVFHLGPRRERQLHYTLRCRQRGYYRLGPTRATMGDVLGIEERFVTVPEDRWITVYPRIVPLQHLGLTTRSAFAARPDRFTLLEDPTRVVGVRDYHPGDSLRHMHWTASARLDHLVVKQYERAMTRETLICLDLDPGSYPVRRYHAIEQAVVVAASLARHMIVRERLSVGMAVGGADPLRPDTGRISFPPRTGAAQLSAVLEVLARIQPRAGHISDLVRQEGLRLSPGATAVVISGRSTPELFGALLHLRRSGYAVELILVQPEHLRLEEGAPLRARRVWMDSDLAVAL